MPASPLDDQSLVLVDVAGRLDRAGIGYMVSGSIALSAYVRPRMTRDIDVVVDVRIEGVRSLLDAFAGGYYLDGDAARRAVLEQRLVNAVHESTLVKVDLVIRKETPYRKAEFERRRRLMVHGHPVSLVTPEDLLLSKVIWSSESQSAMQMEDARQLAATALDWAYVHRWAETLGVADIVNRLRS